MREVWSLSDKANLLFFSQLKLVADESELLLSSSHGRPFAAATFQRIHARTGEALATAKLRDDVRCWCSSRDGNHLYAATSKRLFRLDQRTLKPLLELRRWVPSYCNFLVEQREAIVLGAANEVVFYRGEEQRPTKRRARNLVGLFEAGQQWGLLAFCGEDGRVVSIPNATARPSVLLETAPFRTAALARTSNELYLHRTGLLDRHRYTGSGWSCESLPVDRAFKHLKVGHDCSSLTLIGQSSFQRLDVSGDRMREAETVALVPELDLVEISFKYRLLFAWERQDGGIRVSAHEF